MPRRPEIPAFDPPDLDSAAPAPATLQPLRMHRPEPIQTVISPADIASLSYLQYMFHIAEYMKLIQNCSVLSIYFFFSFHFFISWPTHDIKPN